MIIAEKCESPDKSDTGLSVTIFLLAVLVVAGFCIRVSGLGDRQFAEDEYYFINSVHNVMEFGIPKFSDGGYYPRGILQQYITAFCVLLLGEGYFAYRLPSVLAGTGVLIMAYFLGRQFLNRSWSLVLVAILAFSSWEIEFSRFARMYSGLEFIAVCFFFSLYRYSFDGSSKKRYITVIFAFLAVMTHELGVFIALFLFLPITAWYSGSPAKILREQGLYILISSLVLGIGYLKATFNFRLLGVSGPLPPDFIFPDKSDPLSISLGIDYFGKSGFYSIVALLSGCLIAGYWWYVARNRTNSDTENVFLGWLLIAAACFAFVHQFAMVALIILIVALRRPKMLWTTPYRYFTPLISAVAVFWLALLFYHPVMNEAAGLKYDPRTFLKIARLNLLDFPDLYLPVVRAWAESIPVLASFLASALVWQAFRIRKMPLASIVKNPIIPIAIVMFIYGVYPPDQILTRYSHFLFPLALCVGLMGARDVCGILNRRLIKSENISRITAIFICVTIFAISEEFNLFHLTHPGSDTVAFRTGHYERFEKHWYPRKDFQGPAEFINRSASDGDRIIIMPNVNVMANYLDREFAFYHPRNHLAFPIVSREAGTRELWSGSRMLNRVDDVIEYTRDTGAVWLVRLQMNELLDLGPENLWPGRVKNTEVFVPGRDKRIEVWKIDLRNN